MRQVVFGAYFVVLGGVLYHKRQGKLNASIAVFGVVIVVGTLVGLWLGFD